MKSDRKTYRGRRIEIRHGEREPELLIDNVPVSYGQLPNGQYFLDQYAYDWTDDLVDLAQRFIDYEEQAEVIRRARDSAQEGD
jgi:hypothetical protein